MPPPNLQPVLHSASAGGPASQGLPGSALLGAHAVIFFEQKIKRAGAAGTTKPGSVFSVATPSLSLPTTSSGCLQSWGLCLASGWTQQGQEGGKLPGRWSRGPAATAHVQKPGGQEPGSQQKPTPDRNQLFPTKIFLPSFQFF